MHILLVNDDGIAANGLRCLLKALHKNHKITIAAPARQQSGMSHAVTVHRDILVEKDLAMEAEFKGIDAWKIDGTPADCVKLYLEALESKEKWPDLIISGINEGGNLGTDVIYSGTVGAAVEGYLHGVMSIAVSLEYESLLSYESVAGRMSLILSKLDAVFDKPCLLNINFPKFYADEPGEIVLTRVGIRDYKNAFQYTEKDGRLIYRMEGEIIDDKTDELSDVFQIARGKITVSVLQTDMTDIPLFNRLSGKINL